MTTQDNTNTNPAISLFSNGLATAAEKGIEVKRKRKANAGFLKQVNERKHSPEIVKAAKMFSIMGYPAVKIHEILNADPACKRKISLSVIQSWLHKTNPSRSEHPEDCLTEDEVRIAMEQIPDESPRKPPHTERDITGRFTHSR